LQQLHESTLVSANYGGLYSAVLLYSAGEPFPLEKCGLAQPKLMKEKSKDTAMFVRLQLQIGERELNAATKSTLLFFKNTSYLDLLSWQLLQ